MSLFNDLINGNGNTSFRWSVTSFTGNQDYDYLHYSATYEKSLSHKINLIVEDRDPILCELWYQEKNGSETWVGDESNWKELQNNLKKIENNLVD